MMLLALRRLPSWFPPSGFATQNFAQTWIFLAQIPQLRHEPSSAACHGVFWTPWGGGGCRPGLGGMRYMALAHAKQPWATPEMCPSPQSCHNPCLSYCCVCTVFSLLDSWFFPSFISELIDEPLGRYLFFFFFCCTCTSVIALLPFTCCGVI